MNIKFQANPIRFDHSNSDLNSASSDFQYRMDFNTLSYSSSNWTKLEIDSFEYFYKTYIHSIHLLKVILWTYPFKSTQIWLLIIKSIQTSHIKQHMHIYPIQSTYMHPNKLDQQRYIFIAYDHLIASFNSYIYKPSNISNKSPQLEL
jgi:hypothetical protein